MEAVGRNIVQDDDAVVIGQTSRAEKKEYNV
jgi:hypothetical protein